MVEENKKKGVIKIQVEKIKNSFLDLVQSASGEKLPGWQRYTSHLTPTEKELNSWGLKVALKDYINTLVEIERNWGLWIKNWRKLMEKYAYSTKGEGDDKELIMVSFHRSNDILKQEYTMVKYGTGATEEQIEKEAKGVQEEAVGVDEKKKVPEAKEEKGDLKSSAVNNEIRIYVGNLKDKDNPELLKETRYVMSYPVPKTIHQRYWHSLLNDRDEVVNDWEYSYFGYNAAGEWEKVYKEAITQACNEIQKRILGEHETTKDKVNITPTQATYVKTNIELVKKGYHTHIENFMRKINEREGNLYGQLRATGINAINLDNMNKEFSGEKMPSHAIKGIGKIYFKHSYHVINPDRLVDLWSWNNITGLYREIVRLILTIYDYNINATLEDISKTGLLKDLHSKYPWMEDFWAAYKEDFQKRKFLRPVYTTRNDKIYEEYQRVGQDRSMKEILDDQKPNKIRMNDQKILMELRKKFMILNQILVNPERRHPAPQIFKKPKDKFKELKRKAFLIHQNGFITLPGERAPGWDENGWPLEVADREYDTGEHKFDNFVEPLPAGSKEEGVVLLDLFNWHKRKNLLNKPRVVPKEFIIEMDLLLKATSIHNEWDALRDDLRDGRYHMGSLTITDYAMAQKKSVGAEPIGLLDDEWGSCFMIGEEELERRAEMYKYKANNPRAEFVNENPVYYKMKRYGGDYLEEIRRPTNLNPAFDRRAISRKGGAKSKPWWHIGRKRYYDWANMCLGDLDVEEKEALIGAGVIGPALTTRGLSMYIIEKVLQNFVHYDDAKKVLLRVVGDVWYDYGPRELNKNGPKDPFNLSEQLEGANESVMSGENKEE